MSMSAWHKDRLATSDLVVSPSLYCPVPTIRCHESFPCGASSDGVPIDSAESNPLPFSSGFFISLRLSASPFRLPVVGRRLIFGAKVGKHAH